MAKDTFSHRGNVKKPLFTDSVKRIVLWDIAIFSILFIIANVFTVAITYNVLVSNLDDRLKDETETLVNSFVINRDTISFTGYTEIKEPDFTTINPDALFLQVYSKKGKLLLSSSNLKLLSPIPFKVPEFNSKYIFKNLISGKYKFRTAYTQIYDTQNNVAGYLQLSVFQSEYSSIIEKIITFNLFNLPVILLLIIVASISLTKKSYAPLNKIISIAENISARNLKARIKYKAHPMDELGRLRDTLNNLFERLEFQLNHISQFTDNASHQLMTPLTAIKTELEYILKKERTTSEYKETLTLLNKQTDKMINIIRSLLIIAKFSGSQQPNQNIFMVSQVIDEFIKPAFKVERIKYEIADGLYLRGCCDGFQIVMENLIDNALKYSPEESEVLVEALESDGYIKIKIEDSGKGVDKEEKEKIFERFYRSDSAFKENIQGFGLGLPVVKTIVLSMNGAIRIEDNVPKGTRFIISFPLVNIN